MLNGGRPSSSQTMTPADYFSLTLEMPTQKARVYCYSYGKIGSDDAIHRISYDYILNGGTPSALSSFNTENKNFKGRRLQSETDLYFNGPEGINDTKVYRFWVKDTDGTDLGFVDNKFFPKAMPATGDKILSAIHFYNGTLNNPTNGVVVIIMNDY